MIYDDGVNTNEELRVEFCPRCNNEVFSTHAEYCKICGLHLYNYCLGETISDPNGNHPDWTDYHKNSSDARYCEKCGMPTKYFEEGLLKGWEDAKDLIELNEDESFPPYHSNDDIPF